MKRCFTTRLTFQRLLCGDKISFTDTNAIQEAASIFRARYPAAPIPLSIAAALGKNYVLRGEPKRAVALLATHPSSHTLAREFIKLISQDTTVEIDALIKLALAIRPVSSSISCELLCSITSRIGKGEKVQELKQLLMREIREVPYLAGILLRPLCEVSDSTNTEDKQNVKDALQIALESSFVSPKDYGSVLSLLSRGGEHRRVLTLWSWMHHSSARWDKNAVSAIIISASISRKMNIAISAIQTLAEANEDPTLEAQKYFIRYLASRLPPLSRYADQLVEHWNSNSKLWTTESRVVGVELLFAHYHGKDYHRLRELLIIAETEAVSDEMKQEILKVKGMHYIMRHFAVEIIEETWIRNFYNSGMKIKNLGDYPHLMALLASFARHMKEEDKFLGFIHGIKMNSDAFEEVVTFVADDICFKNAEETLCFINNIANALSHEVPTNVSSWLQLLGQK